MGGVVSYLIPNHINSNIVHPLRTAYHHEYTFYDPDTFLSVTAMVYSGDVYLKEQARKLLETSMGAILPGTGQVKGGRDS